MTNEEVKRKTRRGRRHSLGRLDPSALYTTQGVTRAIGIGRVGLIEARRSGIVKAYFWGGSAYYLGSELIQWITSHPAKMHPKS